MKPPLRTRALSGAALLLAGCNVGEQRTYDELPVEPPEGWVADPQEADDEHIGPWWSRFGTSELDQLVDESLRQNFDLRAVATRVEEAEALARIETGARWPELNLSGNFQRQRQNFVGLPIPGQGDQVLSTTFSSAGAQLNVSWEVDLWNRLQARAQAAVYEWSAASWDLHGARLSLAGQTSKAWFAACEARMQLQLAERTAELWTANLGFVRQRYNQGRADPLDLRFLDADLSAADALVSQREQELAAIVRQLETLLGRYPSGALAVPAELPELPPPPPAGLPCDILRRRPDLVAAEERLAATDLGLYEARTLLYPSLFLTGSGGRLSDMFDDLVDSDFNVWSLGANLTQPLFQGGQLRANVDAADARVRQAVDRFGQDILEALSDVETTLELEPILELQEEQLKRASQQAGAAEDLAQSRFRSGRTDIVTVLVAQRRALEAESQWIRARRSQLDLRVDLHLALGGDFPDELEPNEIPQP